MKTLGMIKDFWRNAIFGKKAPPYPYKIIPYIAVDSDEIAYVDKNHLMNRIEYKKRNEDDFHLIDIRERRDLASGVIETSKSIPCKKKKKMGFVVKISSPTIC